MRQSFLQSMGVGFLKTLGNPYFLVPLTFGIVCSFADEATNAHTMSFVFLTIALLLLVFGSLVSAILAHMPKEELPDEQH